MDSKFKTIAVVDDEEDTVTLYSIALQENGYNVMGFTNPLSFLEYIKDHKDEFDLIILDYRMDPMQGCELSDKIYEINPQIKMVFITAYNNIVNNIRNLEIVKKPITITRLLEIIKQYLS